MWKDNKFFLLSSRVLRLHRSSAKRQKKPKKKIVWEEMYNTRYAMLRRSTHGEYERRIYISHLCHFSLIFYMHSCVQKQNLFLYRITIHVCFMHGGKSVGIARWECLCVGRHMRYATTHGRLFVISISFSCWSSSHCFHWNFGSLIFSDKHTPHTHTHGTPHTCIKIIYEQHNP